MTHRLSLAALAISLMASAAPTVASADDRAFFQSVSGIWSGPGEIVAGKYAGTKFNCQLAGVPAKDEAVGVVMDGSCRVGVFSQKMTASILKTATGYTGQFLDGAQGEGLDIVAGRVEPDRVVMGITRKQLEGAMVARLMDRDTMNITISVKVGESMIPVIGMTLARDLDSLAVGAIE